VPSLQDILNGRINVSQFRDVRLEDLLGREPVSSIWSPSRGQIAGQNVLVTARRDPSDRNCAPNLALPSRQADLSGPNETGNLLSATRTLKAESGSQLVFCVTDIGDRDR